MVVGSMAFANEPVEKYPRYRGYYSFETWFASANAGAQVFVGDHDKQENFGKRITPTISVSVGKWLNPNLIPYAGIGIMTGLNKQKETKFSPNLGVIQTIRLTDKWDLNLDIMGNIVGDAFDGEKGGNKFEGRVAATVGFTYNLR